MLHIFTITLAAYYTLHSVLASNKAKSWLIHRAGFPFRLYRLSYNVIFLVLSFFLIGLYLQIPKHSILNLAPVWTTIGWGFFILGSIIGIAALRQYHLSEFSGFYQLKRNKALEDGLLQTNGLNQLVRHPLYLGTLMVVWGLFIANTNEALLVFAALTTLYTYIGTRLEEKKLVEAFGEAYKNYQKEVPMLLPFLKKGKSS